MREITEKEMDLHEALQLLALARPNPLLAESNKWWDRCHKLLEKYYPEEESK